MKLSGIKQIEGKIELLTGLHIGAGDTELRIGGTDSPVVKHPYTGEPYIPGSSLKGKVRSLLELESGLLAISDNGGKPLGISVLEKLTDDKDKREYAIKLLKLFGVSGSESQEAYEIGPTRASFGDAFLTDESRQFIQDKQLSYYEIKSENVIDRITSTAKHPRFIERVVAGLSFKFSITLKEMDGDGDLMSTLLKGLKLLEYDALGGSGSRGYGRVRFHFEDDGVKEKFSKISLG